MTLELTKDNLPEWKAELRRLMWEQYRMGKYDETLLDEHWIDIYFGFTPQEAIEAEVECWDH